MQVREDDAIPPVRQPSHGSRSGGSSGLACGRAAGEPSLRVNANRRAVIVASCTASSVHPPHLRSPSARGPVRFHRTPVPAKSVRFGPVLTARVRSWPVPADRSGHPSLTSVSAHGRLWPVLTALGGGSRAEAAPQASGAEGHWFEPTRAYHVFAGKTAKS